MNFVLETLQGTNQLPDIFENAQKRALVEAALDFALFFNSVKEHLEVCLAIKVYLELDFVQFHDLLADARQS